MKAKCAIALLSIAMLCISAQAQDMSADDWYREGRELSMNGSWEEAVKAYDNATDLEPENSTLWLAKAPNLNMLALITNNQSARDESLEVIDRALQIDPKNPRAWELKGSALSQAKKYNESLEAYDEAIQNIGHYKGEINQTEELSGIWLSKAVALWQMGRTNESLEAFDNAARADPANFDAWVTLGQVLTYLARYDEAIKAYDRASNIRPDLKALPLNNKGYALMAAGRYEDALRVYEEVTALNLTAEGGHYLAEGWLGTGSALMKLRRYNESVASFDKAIEIDSRYTADAWTGKGDALRNMGNYSEALEAYDRALDLYPDYADSGIARALKGRGDSLSGLGRQDEAMAAYNGSIEAYDEAIMAFNNASAFDKAVSFTFDPYPLDADFWHDRALVLEALRRESEAEESSAKAAEMGYQPQVVEGVAGSGPVVTERIEMVPQAALE